MDEELKKTVETLKNSVESEEFKRKARNILVESADDLKREFYKRMETQEVLDRLSTLLSSNHQIIECTLRNEGQEAANRQLIKCIFQPDDGIYELLQAVISTRQPNLVKKLLRKIIYITENDRLIEILGSIFAAPEAAPEAAQPDPTVRHPSGDVASSAASSISERSHSVDIPHHESDDEWSRNNLC